MILFAPRRATAVTVLALAATRLPAQTHDATADSSRAARTLYQRLPYGSQGYFSPLTVLLNKGFDHFQVTNARRDVWTFPYDRAFRIVFDAFVNPRRAIEHYPGWRRWWKMEVLPLSFSHGESRWFVNYTEHLFGGGVTYRMLDEWYRVRGVPAPRLLAAATTMAASMLNEGVENPDLPFASSSSVADLVFFDVGALLLYNWDPIVRFFGTTLQAADWSNMATFAWPNRELRNSGQYYILKPPLPWTEARLFLRGGMGVQGGLSRRVRGEHWLTLSLGADTETRYVSGVTHDEFIRLRFGGGVYWDRNNSLMASINVSPNADRAKVNVYPGVLPGVGRDLGAWGAVTREGEIIAGVVSRRLLGLGAGYAK